MISTVEHLSMYLCAICVSWEKCLFRSSGLFLIGFFFLLMSCMSYLHFLVINPISDIWFGNIFFHLVSSVQSLSCVRCFAALWTAARQASLSNNQLLSLFKHMSFELVMPFGRLPFYFVDCFLCCVEAFQFDVASFTTFLLLWLVLFDVIPKNWLPRPVSRRFSPTLSSRSFMLQVLHLSL